MNVFLRCLSAEVLKLRRTLALAMTVVAPFVIALLTFAIYNQYSDHYIRAAKNAPWKQLGEMMLTYWSLLMLPLFITLETALLGNLEHAHKNWKLIYTLPVPRWALYMAKLVVCMGLIAISTLTLLIYILLLGNLLQSINPAYGFDSVVPWEQFLRLGLLSYLASWLMIAIHLWLSVHTSSFVIATGAGIAATVVGVFMFGHEVASFYPWTIPGTLSLDLAQQGITQWLALATGSLGSLPFILGALFDVNTRDVV
jgi:hypothetical protein